LGTGVWLAAAPYPLANCAHVLSPLKKTTKWTIHFVLKQQTA